MSSMKTNTKWYAQLNLGKVQGEEGAALPLFVAIEVVPGSRIRDIKGAMRIFAPRPDCRKQRWQIAEGRPFRWDDFHFCSGPEGKCDVCVEPNWVFIYYERHMPQGQEPCHLDVAMRLESEGYSSLDTPESIVVCRGECGEHIAVFNNGFNPPSRRNIGQSGIDDLDAAFRAPVEVWEKAVAVDRAMDLAYARGFVPFPCPVCGKRDAKPLM